MLQRHRRDRSALGVVVAGAAATALIVLAAATGDAASVLLFAALAAVTGLAVSTSPVFAILLLIVLTFLRSALPPIAPIDPFVLAFAGMLGSVGLWVVADVRARMPRLGLVELVMALYILWNAASMVSSHRYAAVGPRFEEPVSVPRLIVISTVMPFALYLVGRIVAGRERPVRTLLWGLLLCGGYSAAISIMQFYGPQALVWPRYVVDAPKWEGRAVGIFNQPVANGLVLTMGFAIGILLASQPGEPRRRRAVAAIIAAACAVGVYLTHTRAAWLALALVVVLGVVWARGFRFGFVLSAAVMVAAVALNWSTFVSADRQAGGVGSPDEVDDRLNTLATSVWAAQHEPWTGWGIGRFVPLNTYHHQQWSTEVDWERGYGIASHLNELGILAELGLIGLGLWVAVLVLLVLRLVRAARVLPDRGVCGRPLAVVAVMAFTALVATGLTVDLRLFDFPNAAVLLVVGLAVGAADARQGRTGMLRTARS